MHIRTPEPLPNALPQDFGALPFAEQLTLWALRLWAEAARTGVCRQRVLADGFALARVGAAHPPLDALLTVINTSATCSIDVRCPACRQVSDDEHRFLGFIAQLQGGATDSRADRFVAAWLPATARRVARGLAAEVAGVLARAGLTIRPRPLPAPPSSHPPSETVH